MPRMCIVLASVPVRARCPLARAFHEATEKLEGTLRGVVFLGLKFALQALSCSPSVIMCSVLQALSS
eukprot:3173609-Amphidinium_carterae.1